MIIITLTIIIILNDKLCSADLWLLNEIKRIVERQIKDKTVNGTFNTVLYLGSVVKISCFGKKRPVQSFRRFSWYHSGKQLSRSDHYQIDKYGTLRINGVTVEDAGEFICLMNSKSGIHKFKHDVGVIQFPSGSLHVNFVYAVRLCSRKSEEFAAHFIEGKVKEKVCLENECTLGYIHSLCYFEEFANPRIKVTVPVIFPGIPNGNCNIQCLREKKEFLKEEIKQKVISAVMQGSRLKIREEPRAMSISYLETKEDSICEPGFEMKGSVGRSLCFPCTPGHFLEKGYCIPCHLNHYSGKYAATQCRACFDRRITRNRGSISEDDCYWADPDVLWILFAFFFTVALLLLFCCCCSVLKFLRISVLGKCVDAICSLKFFRRKKVFNSNREKGKSHSSESREKSKSLLRNTKESKRFLNKTSINASGSSFVIPSVRRSTAKDFLYKPLRPVAKHVIPPPPALPTDSILNQATRNMTYHTAARADKPETRNVDQNENKTVGRHAASKINPISSKESDPIMPQYRERIKNNKPMLNAYIKSRV